MRPFEFIVPKRPLSHQAADASHKQAWKQYVYGRAFREWVGLPMAGDSLRFTLAYLCEQDPPDINNIIKPVQDALNGLVYADDSMVVDVQGHLRMTSEFIDLTGLPQLLQDAIISGVDCLYVRVDPSQALSNLL